MRKWIGGLFLATVAVTPVYADTYTKILSDAFATYRAVKQCVDDKMELPEGFDADKMKAVLVLAMKDFQAKYVAKYPDADPTAAWEAVASGDAYDLFLETLPDEQRASIRRVLENRGVNEARELICNVAGYRFKAMLGLNGPEKKDF